jgi:uncharacterized membrane protein YkvI
MIIIKINVAILFLIFLSKLIQESGEKPLFSDALGIKIRSGMVVLLALVNIIGLFTLP